MKENIDTLVKDPQAKVHKTTLEERVLAYLSHFANMRNGAGRLDITFDGVGTVMVSIENKNGDYVDVCSVYAPEGSDDVHVCVFNDPHTEDATMDVRILGRDVNDP